MESWRKSSIVPAQQEKQEMEKKLRGETRDKCIFLNFHNEVTGHIPDLKGSVRDTTQQTIKEMILFRLLP